MRTSSVVHLPCAPASVALARKALSEDLRAAGVFDHAVADAALVISELLSNAILHAYPLPGERLQVAWAVDASSSLELSPGIKDHAKLRSFVANAKRAR